MEPPFPFVYLNHGILDPDSVGKVSGLYVGFTKPIDPGDRTRILEGCPPPTSGLSWWSSTLLHTETNGDVFEEQLVARFGNDGGGPKEDWDATLAAFASKVESWAREVHRTFPIAFLVGPLRAVEPSPWGRWSRERSPAVMVPLLEQAIATDTFPADVEGDGTAPVQVFDRDTMAALLETLPRVSGELASRARALRDRFGVAEPELDEDDEDDEDDENFDDELGAEDGEEDGGGGLGALLGAGPQSKGATEDAAALLGFLVEREQLVLAEGHQVAELTRATSRILGQRGDDTDKAEALSGMLLDHPAVDELYLDEDTLASVIGQFLR